MFHLNDDFTFRDVGGRVVLLDNDSGYYYSLNETGTLIFRGIINNSSMDKIRDMIVDKYSISEEEARNDIDSFISELTKENILKRN